MNYEIIVNFLEKEVFLKIKNEILNNDNFPWYMVNGVANEADENHDLYFCHLVYDKNKINSSFYKNLLPIITKINIKKIIRIKINLYHKTNSLIKHSNHVDYDYPHKGCIFYLNSNDGKTIINDTVEIDSIENRILFFEPNKIHCSTTCTNHLYRSNINFNYF